MDGEPETCEEVLLRLAMPPVDFECKHVQFHDSLPSHSTSVDKKQVHEGVMALLGLLESWELDMWEWVRESVCVLTP